MKECKVTTKGGKRDKRKQTSDKKPAQSNMRMKEKIYNPAGNLADCQVSATVSDGIYSTVSLTMGPLGRHSTPTSHPALRGVGLPTKAMPAQPIVKELSRHKTPALSVSRG
jgi:hypothetical protein